MIWQFELVDGPYGGVTEGPAWNGSRLLFTHIPGSRIMSFDPQKRSSEVHQEGTNWANGLMFDVEGRLYACEGATRRIVRYETRGEPTVLTDKFENSRLNIPNDLAIDKAGRVWFTDPFYEGAAGPWSNDSTHKELSHDSVYRLDPQSDKNWAIQRVTFDTIRPNGILFSLDYKTLYIAESAASLGPKRAGEKRQLLAYPVKEDATLGEASVLHDFGSNRGIDGMCLDTNGNIIATAGWERGGPGPSVYVFSPIGDILEIHPLNAQRPTNCTFGDEDLSTLYVTTTEGHLFRARTNRKGRLWYPPL